MLRPTGAFTSVAVRRLPQQWKAPVLALTASRAVPALVALSVLLPAFVAIDVRRGDRSAAPLLFYLGLGIGMGMTAGLLGEDRRESRWVLLFQRPGTPLLHYSRVVTAAFAAIVSLHVMALAVAAAITGSSGVRTVFGGVVTSLILAVAVAGVAIGMSALRPRGDAALTLALLVVSLYQALVWDTLGWAAGAPARETAAALLFPFDAVAELARWIVGAGDVPGVGRIAHLCIYPAAWLAVAGWRLHRMQEQDIPAGGG